MSLTAFIRSEGERRMFEITAQLSVNQPDCLSLVSNACR